MRTALIVFVVLAGCSDPTVPPVEPDASEGNDAAVDAGGIDGTPGPIDGTWQLTWTCLDNCGAQPSLAISTTLMIAGTNLGWRNTTCAECDVDHVGSSRAMCLDVGPTANELERYAAYSACVDDGGALGVTLGVTRIFGDGRTATWRGVGRRQ